METSSWECRPNLQGGETGFHGSTGVWGGQAPPPASVLPPASPSAVFESQLGVKCQGSRPLPLQPFSVRSQEPLSTAGQSEHPFVHSCTGRTGPRPSTRMMRWASGRGPWGELQKTWICFLALLGWRRVRRYSAKIKSRGNGARRARRGRDAAVEALARALLPPGRCTAVPPPEKGRGDAHPLALSR